MNTAKKIYLIFITVFICRCISQTDVSEEDNVDPVHIPDNVTKMNVQVCTGTSVNIVTIVDKDLTWFEATALCKAMNFGSLDIAPQGWPRRNQVRSLLEGIDYKGLDYSFWTGIFRSFDQNTNWFFNRKQCKPFPGHVNVDSLKNGLCVAIERNESSLPYKESMFVDDCKNKRPLVCINYAGPVPLLSYSGFEFPEDLITSSMRPLMLYNVTTDHCIGKCLQKSDCSSFTFNHDERKCTILGMIFANDRQYHETYSIIKSSKNVTHYAKTGCQLTFTTANLSSAATIDTVIPDCEKDETNSDCPCAIEESTLTESEIVEVVNELVVNLTVDPKNTAARRRKLSCAEDSRYESKAVGSVGVIVITVILSLPVIADIFIPGGKKKSQDLN